MIRRMFLASLAMLAIPFAMRASCPRKRRWKTVNILRDAGFSNSKIKFVLLEIPKECRSTTKPFLVEKAKGVYSGNILQNMKAVLLSNNKITAERSEQLLADETKGSFCYEIICGKEGLYGYVVSEHELYCQGQPLSEYVI